MPKQVTITLSADAEDHLEKMTTDLNSIPNVKRLSASLLINEAILKLNERDIESIRSRTLTGEDRLIFEMHRRGITDKEKFLDDLLRTLKSPASN